MNNFENANYSCGDLALIQNIAQTYTEEIKSLLFLQYCMKAHDVKIDFNTEIDLRLLTVSELNHLLVSQMSDTFPEPSLTAEIAPKIEIQTLLKQLQKLIDDAKQNIALINSMHRFIKNKAVKQQLEKFTYGIKSSLEELQEKEAWLLQALQDQKE